MIARLHSSLRALSQLSAAELESAGTESLRRDCADAVRLELDCRQLELGVSACDVLAHLSELLEASEVHGAELASAIRAAVTVLGIRSRERAT